ncbi:MAG: Slp family lipoprotein [Deltaproteobacteria bacterium]|nr:Slp family lipoprotein [Deltaproteobacteria bacterium]
MDRGNISALIMALILVFINLSGCASVIPRELKKDLDLDITFEDVIARGDSLSGEKILWGGVIATSKNEVGKTVIEVVQVPLGSSDRPGNIDLSKGRFIVEHKGYLETAIYSEGREITVAGKIRGTRPGKVGQMNYSFPLVESIKIHLWEKKVEEVYPYYDPFYDPFYPWCRPYSPFYPYPYLPHRHPPEK